MDILVVILLAVIAYILWRIYRQKEEEKQKIADEKFEAEWEQKNEDERKEKFKDYPHLYKKLEGNWLDVFAAHAENKIPLLKLAFRLYLEESVKIDISEGEQKWHTLWDLTEELLEHLEKFHEGTTTEHLIAVCTYWQIAAEAISELIKESPEKTVSEKGREYAPIEGKKLEAEPFTNISKIVELFPKKDTHPAKEITFSGEKGEFPRESKGAISIHDRIDM